MKELDIHQTTEYFYFGTANEDHSRDPAPILKTPSQALETINKIKKFFESYKRESMIVRI